MLVTPLVLIQIFSKRMLVDWPKCGSDPRDEGHLACLKIIHEFWLPLIKVCVSLVPRLSPTVFLTAYVTFEPPREAGEGLV